MAPARTFLKGARPRELRGSDLAVEGTQQSHIDEIVEELAEIGLAEEPARVFVHLSILGPSKVRRISESTGLERSKTYRTLDGLEEMGFVKASLERPTRYEALEIEEIFGRLIDEKRDELEHLEETRGRLVPALQQLASAGRDEAIDAPSFRTIQGRDAIYRNVKRMVEQAQEEVIAMSTHPAAVQLGTLSGVEEVAVEKLEEGVRIRAILGSSEKVLEQMLEREPPEGYERSETRLWATDRLIRFLVRDGEELLLYVVNDPSEKLRSEHDVALLTDAASLVHNQLAFFETVWAEAEPVAND